MCIRLLWRHAGGCEEDSPSLSGLDILVSDHKLGTVVGDSEATINNPSPTKFKSLRDLYKGYRFFFKAGMCKKNVIIIYQEAQVFVTCAALSCQW